MNTASTQDRPASGRPRGQQGDSLDANSLPLHIYTLGRFSLVRAGRPLCPARKSPGKPLLLLKALIASGGRQVGAATLAASLWPDKDGDLALQSFEVTLHRLRKYLGDGGYLRLEDGHLTLDSAQVWVDAWAFERQLGELRRLLARPVSDTAARRLDALADDVLRLYQGHFLCREDLQCWMVSMQERLRSKFVHGLLDLGRYWESRGLLHRAVACYRKGIEVDDLIETFYQRLMHCLRETGRVPEAIAAYRQCRQVLSVVLGLAPDTHTTQIYHTLLERHARRA
ncbi:MAG: BTAD domain-containing putative transcriptional regulator [Gammaproteobacteria bacterium]|jgi:DNA-binding SARP family transcriptional activator